MRDCIATTLNSSNVIIHSLEETNMICNPPITQMLTWLMTRTKGGKTRTQIIKTLKTNPQNTNQLATQLKKDYKTISHHLGVLEKNKLVIPIGDHHYSTAYFLSQTMEENYRIFEEITDKENRHLKLA